MRETFQIAVSRACRLAGFSRAAWYKRSTARDQSVLRMIRELLRGERPANYALDVAFRKKVYVNVR